MEEGSFSFEEALGRQVKPSRNKGEDAMASKVNIPTDEVMRFELPSRNLPAIEQELKNPKVPDKYKGLLETELASEKARQADPNFVEKSPFAEKDAQEPTDSFSFEDAQKDPESFSFEEAQKTTPGWGSTIAQGVASSVGDLQKGLGRLVGSTINGIGNTDIGDSLIKNVEQRAEDWGTAFQSKEEQANQSLPQKIVGGVAGVAPYLLAGPAGALVAGATSGMNTGADLLQQGATLGQAEVSGLTSAATGYGSMKLPMGAASYTGGAAKGAAGNLAAGIVNDTVISQVMSDRPDIAKNYNPLDLEKRLIEGVTGGAFGAGYHGVQKVALAKNIKQNNALTAKINKDLATDKEANVVLENEINNLVSNRVKTGWTLDEVVQPNQGAILHDAWDAIKIHPKARPDQVALVEASQRLHDVNGAGDTPLEHRATPFVDPLTNKSDAYNHYDINDRKIIHKLDGRSPEDQIRILLHEGLHAASAHTIDWYELTPLASLKTPQERSLWQRTNDLNEVFKRIKEEHTLATKESPDNVHAMWQKHASPKPPAFDTWTVQQQQNYLANRTRLLPKAVALYGFKDLHEFVTETLTKKSFQDLLSSYEFRPAKDPYNSAPVKRGMIANAFEAVKKAIKNLIGGENPSSYLDVAMDHVFGLLEDGKMHGRNAKGRAMQIADASRALEAAPLAKAKMKRIADLLDVSGDNKEMFDTRLRAESSSPEWQAFVDRNFNSLWDNSRRIRETVGEDKKYKTLSEEDKLLQHNPLNADEFINDNHDLSKPLIPADDLSASGTDIMGSNVTVQLKGRTIAGKVMKFVKDKAAEFKELQAILFHDSMSKFASYNKLGVADKKLVIDTAAVGIDNMLYRAKLEAQGLQWPTEQMLRTDFPELGDKHIKAYLDITKGLDFLHSLLNQTRHAMGQEPLKQIPGYFPHVFDGAFKVFVTHEDAKGNKKVVLVKGFPTAYGAKDYVKAIQSGAKGPNVGVKWDTNNRLPYHVQKNGDLTSGIVTNLQQHLKAYYNQLALTPEARKIIEDIEKTSMQGFSKHVLERTDVSGWLGEFGTSDTKGIAGIKERLGILSGDNKKILNLYENYARSVTEYYKNVLFTKEVTSRMLGHGRDGDHQNYGHLFDDTPKLVKHLSEYIYNFTGENINHLAKVDDVLRASSLKLGLDPNAYRRGVRDIRNLLSQIKLRVNPGNYIANLVQPIHIMSLLQFVNATHGLNGGKSPNVMATLSRVMSTLFNPTESQKSALAWAKERHILDAQLEPEMRGANPGRAAKIGHLLTFGGVNPTIESLGRKTSFLLAYEHFKQIYPKDEMAARRAAVNIMEMGMVNYDRSSRPLMYQNLGVVGEAMSPFAVFRNAYVGNTYLMMRLVAQNPKKLGAYMPLLMMQSTYLATAGALGMVGAAEYDAIIGAINTTFPSAELPTLAEMLFKLKVPDVVTYGTLSTASKAFPGFEEGVNLGGAFNAVGADDLSSVAMAPFITAIATVAGIGVRELLHLLAPEKVDPVGSSALFSASKQIVPSMAHKYLEDHFKDNEDIALTNSGEGGTYRTRAGDNALMAFGKKSVEESKRNTKNLVIKQSQQQIQTELKNLTEIAADHAMDIREVDRNALYRRVRELGSSLEEFQNGVVEVLNKRRTTVEFREAQRQTNKAMKSQHERMEME